MIRNRVASSSLAPLAAALGAVVAAGCSAGEDAGAAQQGQAHAAGVSPGRARAGQRLFDLGLSGTNGRTCTTCHPLAEHTTLSPASVSARLAADPGDVLFNRIDADDPSASTLTYDHLEKGLIRITLPLPANIDLINFDGDVVTPPDRMISVWRGVPSVENTAYTAPLLADGRGPTLEQQALGALDAHSEIQTGVGNGQLGLIADFERTLYTSDRAMKVAVEVAAGVPIADIPDPEEGMILSAEAERGRLVYNRACTGCHGAATDNIITNRTAHDQIFFQVDSNGNVVFVDVPGVGPVPRESPEPGGELINIGMSFASYLGQIGQLPTFNADVDLPRYRLRFYTDATRTIQVTDLPPIPVTASGQPFDPVPAVDPATGAPIVGPNFGPQWWSTDPGRCLITGRPVDFEAFDVPQLRGIGNTAPYFHDNSHGTLADVVDTYSRFILAAVPGLGLPPVSPPEHPGLPPESLTPLEKADLVAFLLEF